MVSMSDNIDFRGFRESINVDSARMQHSDTTDGADRRRMVDRLMADTLLVRWMASRSLPQSRTNTQ